MKMPLPPGFILPPSSFILSPPPSPLPLVGRHACFLSVQLPASAGALLLGGADILVCPLPASAGAFLPPPSGQRCREQFSESGPARGPGMAALAGAGQTGMSAPPLRQGCPPHR